EHVHIREVDERDAVGRSPREPDLPVAVVHADDARGAVDQPVLRLAPTAGRPVAHLAQEAVDLGSIDARLVVVELEAAAELAPHATASTRSTTSVTRTASSAGTRRAPRRTR